MIDLMTRSRTVSPLLRTASLAVTLLGLSQGAQARGFYLDSSRPDNSGDGRTPQTAWKDFGGMSDVRLAPGDTFYLERGSVWTDVRGFLPQVGTKSEPFVVTAHGDPAKPLPKIVSSDSNYALGLAASHLVLEKLAISGNNAKCIVNATGRITDITLQELEISDCREGINLTVVDSVLVRNNKFSNIRFGKDRVGAIGITLSIAAHARILDNEFRDCIDGKGATEGGGAIQLFRYNRDIEIAGNRALRTAGFLKLWGLHGDLDSMAGIYVHHNIAMETQHFAWSDAQTPQDDPAEWAVAFRDVFFDHNTMIQDHRWGQFAIGVGTPLSDSTRMRVRDNLFTGDSLMEFLHEGPFSRGTNLFWSSAAGSNYPSPKFATDLVVDPLLIPDTATISYSLGASSPAKRAGASYTYPGSTVARWTPPSASAHPDLGALDAPVSTLAASLPKRSVLKARHTTNGLVVEGIPANQAAPRFLASTTDGRILSITSAESTQGAWRLEFAAVPTGAPVFLRIQSSSREESLVLVNAR
ncbi:MAG: right-handed parallel beta-helix repeat-containing protein [Fibrobacterota bacterium]|nr:right-handed parallel beta-helix repeat-containing protein [Fibrobacterota bacterium]QQS06179.1 MAG: right-handed parallel beta-helix repeat-containing protein [Fibrobacterota bacterium]